MTDETENPLPEEATENTSSVEDDWAAAMAEQAVADACRMEHILSPTSYNAIQRHFRREEEA